MAILKLGGKLFAEHNEQTDTVSLANDVVLPTPAGHIIQTKLGHFAPVSNSDDDTIIITNNGATSSNPDNLNSTQNRLFWLGNRVIVEVMRVSITIRDASNDLLVFCSAGCTAGQQSSNGAWGFIVGVPHDGNSGEAYDLSNYPYYRANVMPGYPPDWSGHFGIKGSSGCLSAGQTDVKLYAFAYSEGDKHVLKIRRAEMTVMEVQT